MDISDELFGGSNCYYLDLIDENGNKLEKTIKVSPQPSEYFKSREQSSKDYVRVDGILLSSGCKEVLVVFEGDNKYEGCNCIIKVS